MKKKKILLGILAGLGCAIAGSAITIAGISYALGFTGDSIQNLVRFVGVRRFIESRYVGDVDDTALMDGAISGMVQSPMSSSLRSSADCTRLRSCEYSSMNPEEHDAATSVAAMNDVIFVFII